MRSRRRKEEKGKAVVWLVKEEGNEKEKERGRVFGWQDRDRKTDKQTERNRQRED